MPQASPGSGAGARSTRSLVAVLAFLAVGLTLAADLWSQGGTSVVITGAVTSGAPFVGSFGAGFALRLQGQQGIWVIEITHAGSGEKDLIYPVNPPYRFSNHQHIGPGYGESARESASNTPREFAFLARPDDVGRAWEDVERVLWPYTHSEAAVQQATDELARLP